MGSFFSHLQDTTTGGGHAHALPTIIKNSKKSRVKAKSTTYKRLRSALERVGFKSRLIDRHLVDRESHREFRDYNDVDAVRLVWLQWRKASTEVRGDDLLDLLYTCAGIKKSAAVEYASTFGQVWNEGQLTFVQLIDLIIEYALGRYAPIRPPSTSFLLPMDHAPLTSLSRIREHMFLIKFIKTALFFPARFQRAARLLTRRCHVVK